MKVVVRKAEREDIPRISVLWALWVRSVDPENGNPDIDAFVDFQMRIMGLPEFHYFVAEVDGRMVGFVNGFIDVQPSTGKKIGCSEQLYVLPEFRGSQVGGMLFRRMVESANESGAEVLALQCRPEKKDFWEKKGFKVKKITLEKDL